MTVQGKEAHALKVATSRWKFTWCRYTRYAHQVKVAALGKGERPMLPKVIKCMQALLQARVS